MGRGAAFAQGNFGDPGGVELEDVMAGARWAVSNGLVPAGKPAVMGSSWGGYLSAVAATARATEISAAVVGAGISDITSCRNTCNNPPFYDIFLGGLPSDEPGAPVMRRALGCLPRRRARGSHPHPSRGRRPLRSRFPGARTVQRIACGRRRGRAGYLPTRGAPGERARPPGRLLGPGGPLAFCPPSRTLPDGQTAGSAFARAALAGF